MTLMNTNHVPENEPNAEAPANPLEQFVTHQKRAVEETVKAVDALLPTGFKEHGAEAGREFVKGFKVLVDAAITELEKAAREMDKSRTKPEDQDRPSSTGAAKVKVQVE